MEIIVPDDLHALVPSNSENSELCKREGLGMALSLATGSRRIQDLACGLSQMTVVSNWKEVRNVRAPRVAIISDGGTEHILCPENGYDASA